MTHQTKLGDPRPVRRCTLPLTAPSVVNRIVSDVAIVAVTREGFLLREYVPGWTVEEFRRSPTPRSGSPRNSAEWRCDGNRIRSCPHQPPRAEALEAPPPRSRLAYVRTCLDRRGIRRERCLALFSPFPPGHRPPTHCLRRMRLHAAAAS